MAKKKQLDEFDDDRELRAGLVELPAEEMVEEDQVEEEGEPEPAVPEGPARWRVGLVCPTPLAFPSLEVEARNETEARAEFCKRNGISGSVHSWTIERIG